MRDESICLLGGVLLGFVYIFAASAAETRERGVMYNFSPRDGDKLPLKGVPARLNRASHNFKETFPLFVASVVLLQMNDRFGQISAAGSWLYLGARVIYLPLYALGIKYVRTAVWSLSLLGIFANLYQVIA